MGLSDLVYPASNWDQTTNYRPCAKVPRDQSPKCIRGKSNSAESLRPKTGYLDIPGQQLKVTLDNPPPFLWLWSCVMVETVPAAKWMYVNSDKQPIVVVQLKTNQLGSGVVTQQLRTQAGH